MSGDLIWGLVAPSGIVNLRSLRQTRSEVIDFAVTSVGYSFWPEGFTTLDRMRLSHMLDRDARAEKNQDLRRRAWTEMRRVVGYRVAKLRLIEDTQ